MGWTDDQSGLLAYIVEIGHCHLQISFLQYFLARAYLWSTNHTTSVLSVVFSCSLLTTSIDRVARQGASLSREGHQKQASSPMVRGRPTSIAERSRPHRHTLFTRYAHQGYRWYRHHDRRNSGVNQQWFKQASGRLCHEPSHPLAPPHPRASNH